MVSVVLSRPEVYYFLTWGALLVVAHLVGSRDPARRAPGWAREFSWKWLAPVSRELRRFGPVSDRVAWPGRHLLVSCTAGYASLVGEAMRKIRR